MSRETRETAGTGWTKAGGLCLTFEVPWMHSEGLCVLLYGAVVVPCVACEAYVT